MSDKKGDIENMGRSPPGFEIEIEEIDDGHSPGGTSLPTQLVSYKCKQSVGFLSVYDNLLPELWRERTYDYALGRPMPWGNANSSFNICFYLYLSYDIALPPQVFMSPWLMH